MQAITAAPARSGATVSGCPSPRKIKAHATRTLPRLRSLPLQADGRERSLRGMRGTREKASPRGWDTLETGGSANVVKFLELPDAASRGSDARVAERASRERTVPLSPSVGGATPRPGTSGHVKRVRSPRDAWIQARAGRVREAGFFLPERGHLKP
jgi:hypothetical protein